MGLKDKGGIKLTTRIYQALAAFVDNIKKEDDYDSKLKDMLEKFVKKYLPNDDHFSTTLNLTSSGDNKLVFDVKYDGRDFQIIVLPSLKSRISLKIFEGDCYPKDEFLAVYLLHKYTMILDKCIEWERGEYHEDN